MCADIRTFEVLLRSYEVQKVALGTCPTAERKTISASPPHKRICVAGDIHAPKRAAEVIFEWATNGASDKDRAQTVVARPSSEMKGHTGYLTFARIFS